MPILHFNVSFHGCVQSLKKTGQTYEAFSIIMGQVSSPLEFCASLRTLRNSFSGIKETIEKNVSQKQ